MAEETRRARGKEFVVPERHYSGIDAQGHRQLLYRKGQRISWDEAVEAGLANHDRLSPEQVSFTLQHSVIVDGRLVHRTGAVISLAEAIELGVVGTTEEEGDSGNDPDDDPDASAEAGADGAGAGTPPDKKDPSDGADEDGPDADKAGAPDGAGEGDPDADKAGASQKAAAGAGEGPLKKLTSKGRPTAGA